MRVVEQLEFRGRVSSVTRAPPRASRWVASSISVRVAGSN